MKREFYARIIVLSTLLVACEAPLPQQEACTLPGSGSNGQLAQKQDGTTAQEPRECVLPEPAREAELTVNLSITDFNALKEDKLRDAVERMVIVINSEDFKQKVLNHEYQGVKTFVDNNNLTNEEVYQTLLDGVETLNGVLDNEIDLDLTLYYANNSTVGYTYPNTNRVWINDKFFTTNTPGKVAGNLVHEWTHKLGFGHDFNVTQRRNYSVPYAVGNIIQELVDSL